MAPFQDHEIWEHRPDAEALVQKAGVLCVDPADQPQLDAWLHQAGYTIHTLDGRGSLRGFRHALGVWLDWEGQCGYRLESNESLDALADGFTVTVPNDGGLVLEILGIDHLLAADAHWTNGMLAINMEQSLFHLACGRRFWVLLPVDPTTTLPDPWPHHRYWPRPRFSDSGSTGD